MISIIKKLQSAPIQVKAASWFIVCNFVLKGISFISAPVFTRVLSTEDYGIVAVFNSYQQIVLIFATLELSLGAYTKGYLKYNERVNEFTSNLIILGNIITLICFCVFFIFKNLFINLTGVSFTCVLLMFVLFMVQPSYQCWMFRERFCYKYKGAVAMTLISAVVTTFVPLVIVVAVDNSANTKIVTTLLCSIVVAFPFYVDSLIRGRLVVDKAFWMENAKFCLSFQAPLVIHSLSFLILGQSDRMMISEMVGKSQAAIYSVSYSLAVVVSIFQSSINQVFQPYRYQKMQSGDDRAIRTTTNSLLIFFAGLILVFILIAPEAIDILFPKDYYEAIWVIPPVAVGIFFTFLYSIFVDVESYYEKTKYVMYASIICAITNVILNYYGIKLFGYIACAYTTLICYILFAIMHYIFMRRTCKKCRIDLHFFDEKIILLISVVITILGVCFTLLYRHMVIRYIILLFVLVIGVVRRKDIVMILSIKKEDKNDVDSVV